jgi:hypothetical protein
LASVRASGRHFSRPFDLLIHPRTILKRALMR